MPYEYLDNIAAADIAFKAWHNTLEQTFVSAAEATMNVMVEELDSIQACERREIRLENDNLGMLLFDFLQELIYYKDSELLLLRVHNLLLEIVVGNYRLSAQADGEKLNVKVHNTRVDVKAVTLYRFALEQTDLGWEAMVVLDI
jgi:SHS2 domain-containing protein